MTVNRVPRLRLILGGALLVLMALVAFGIYTGEPVFFFKWLVGLQADD